MAELLQPIAKDDWGRREATHLLNRAGFGVPRSLGKAFHEMGLERAIDHLVTFEERPFSFPDPGFIVPFETAQNIRRDARKLDEDERRRQYQLLRREERDAVHKLTGWWLERMYRTPRPLEEKLTLFWQGHFVTSAQKVQSSEYNYRYNALLREHAAGNLKAFTIAVGQAPSMLHYLDNAKSTKGRPNENWARELLELFTMGPGNYTEHDIKEAARAFTGWTIRRGEFRYVEKDHDPGAKTFLDRTGNFDGWDIIDIIFDQPATAEHFTRELWTYFAYDNPEPEVVAGLAATLRANDYALRPMLRQMFTCRAFYSERAIATQIKSPAQFLIQIAHDMAIETPPFMEMAKASAALGQNLLAPPNVSGWDGNKAWINANSLLNRYNIPPALAGAKAGPLPSEMARQDKTMSMTSMAEMMDSGDEAKTDQGNPIRDMLVSLEPAQRKAWRERLRDASSKAERRRVVAALRREVTGRGPWSAENIFEDLQFSTAGECIDALAARYLSVPLTEQQRAVLLDALGAPDGARPMGPADVASANRNAVLHLLFSTAEYQLC